MNLSEILERQDKIKEIYGDIRAALLDVSDRLEELKNIADEIELDKLELTAAEFEKLIKHGITLGAKIRVVSAYNSPFHTITGIRADGFIATSLDNDVSIVGRRELEHLDKIEVMK